ncbi:MAG: ABC transporter permease [Thermoplasmata archaeon]
MSILRINPGAIYSVAKKEFADNLRNKWIVALTVIFVVLTIVTSYLAGGQARDSSVFGGMEETVIMLLSISTILIPLIAIMLGYATISGECESGSLGVVLAYPVRRVEVLLGKLSGLSSVLIVSTVVGFGAGGIVIAATVGTESWAAYLVFIGLTILLGILYLSMSMLFSAISARRTTSLGAAVILFFWSMIYGMIVFGIYIASGGDLHELIMGNATFPDWIWASVILSPMDMSQMSVMLAFGVEQVFGFNVEVPSFISLGLLVMVQILWIEVALVLAYYFFEKRDV